MQEATISEDLLSFLKSAFTNQLSKEVWTNVMEQYPDIKGTAEFLVSPVMQTGMKDDIKRVHGFAKTKDLFTFDDGLADKQAPFISAVRPLVCALQSLEMDGGVDDDGEEIQGPDPDHIKALIEDAIVLLGNAHCRLNSWRQRRFAEFLTDVGKRTLKDQIPADKHLFPEQFHNVIREEHDHANTNRKLVAQPIPTQKRFFPGPRGKFQSNNSFRNQSYRRSTFGRPQKNDSFGKNPNNRSSWSRRGGYSKHKGS